MGSYRVELDVGFQGRLRKQDELVRAEHSVVNGLLEDYGLDATTVPRFSVTEHVETDGAGRELWRDVQFKVRGTWTFIRVQTRAPGVFVLFDRPY